MVDRLELQTMDQMLEAPLPMAEAEEIPDWLRGFSNLEQPLLEEPESMHSRALCRRACICLMLRPKSPIGCKA